MVALLGTGSALPLHEVTNDDLSEFIDTSDEWIYPRTGIHSRHYVDDETALSLAMKAARQAIDAAGIQPNQLGAVICATFTSDYATPSLACEVIREFEIQCPAFDLNAACSGFLYASKVAMSTFPDRPVLVIGCEIMSRVLNFEDRTTCVLCGDGAGAAVFGPSAGESAVLASQIMAYPDANGDIFVGGLAGGKSEGQGHYFKDKFDKTSPRAQFTMNGAEVYKFATRTLVEEVESLLTSQSMTPDDVDWYVPHQANVRIIKTAAQKLGQPMDKFFVNIDKTGNTSAASIIIALDELLRSGKVDRGQILALAAFGGGLTSGSMLLRY